MVDAKIKGRGPVEESRVHSLIKSVSKPLTLPRSLALSVLRRTRKDLELQGLGEFEVSNILKSVLIMTGKINIFSFP